MFKELSAYIDGNNIWMVIGILGFVFLHFAIEPIRWVFYLGRKDKGSLFTLFYIFSSTAFFSYVLPAKLGIPLRFWLIKHYQTLSSGTVGVYMIVDSVMIMGSWTLASLVVGGDFAFEIIQQNLKQFYNNVAMIFVVVLATLFLSFIFIRIGKKNTFKRFVTAVQKLRWQQSIIVIILFVIDISSYVFRHALIIALVSDLQIGWQSIAAITILSIFAGFVSAMPMGLIGYDATIIFLLTQQGMNIEIAALVPIINRAANLLVSIMLGIPSAFKLNIGLDVKEFAKKVNFPNYV